MKKETLQEFLARGGKVKVIPAVLPEETKSPVRSTIAKPVATILTLEEADQLYGSKKTDQKRKRKSTDSKSSKKMEELRKSIEALPQDLRDKLKINL